MKNNVLESKETMTSFIHANDFLEHWQGHRRLTRRVIETFPDDKLFTYSVGGMRPFSDLAIEMIGMAYSGVNGVATGKWASFDSGHRPKTKTELLNLWDEVTEIINKDWSEIPSERFLMTDVAFGQYENVNNKTILYFLENEIHHRAQGYVYLRTLGIVPPFFWER